MAERFPFGPASTARKSTPRCPFGRIAIYGYRTISNEIQTITGNLMLDIPTFQRPSVNFIRRPSVSLPGARINSFRLRSASTALDPLIGEEGLDHGSPL